MFFTISRVEFARFIILRPREKLPHRSTPSSSSHLVFLARVKEDETSTAMLCYKMFGKVFEGLGANIRTSISTLSSRNQS